MANLSSSSRSSCLAATRPRDHSSFPPSASTGTCDEDIYESTPLLGRVLALPSTLQPTSVMASIRRSKAGRFLDKIAVAEVEPGLTGTQLMLLNHDLKPVEPGTSIV